MFSVQFSAFFAIISMRCARGIRTPDPVITKREIVMVKGFLRIPLNAPECASDAIEGSPKGIRFSWLGRTKGGAAELARTRETATELQPLTVREIRQISLLPHG